MNTDDLCIDLGHAKQNILELLYLFLLGSLFRIHFPICTYMG